MLQLRRAPLLHFKQMPRLLFVLLELALLVLHVRALEDYLFLVANIQRDVPNVDLSLCRNFFELFS